MPLHGFLLAAAEWFHHCLRCEPCERHLPDCSEGQELFDHMKQLAGEEA